LIFFSNKDFIWSQVYAQINQVYVCHGPSLPANCIGDEGYKYLPGCVEEGAAKDTRKAEVGIHWSFCS